MGSLTIDYIDNTIIIGNIKSLRSNQISQLRFWGFKKHTDNSYELFTDNPSIKLAKVLSYFNKENLNYCLLEPCNNYITKINNQKKFFEETKTLGREYKDGVFNQQLFSEFCDFIKNNIDRKLKEHQLKSAYHLYLVKNGANFSVPGSGKTSSILGVYEKLKQEGEVNLLFVIGPPACFGPWKVEFEATLGRKPLHTVLAGGDLSTRKSEYYKTHSQRSELYLTTFHTLFNDQDEVVDFLKINETKPFLVIDEAHYIKQINGSWANAALNISKYAEYKCVLTGTPIPRGYEDVFNLFDFLWPTDEPISQDAKIRIQNPEASNDTIDYRVLLQDAIGPLFYRVRKSELNLIPPVFHEPIIIEMNKYERMLYDAIYKKISLLPQQDYIKNAELIRRLKRGRIIRLRQSVSYTKLLTTVIENYDERLIEDESDLCQIIGNYDDLETPSKVEYIIDFAKELQQKKEKFIIWANFVNTLKLLKEHLTRTGLYCKLIYGDTPIEQTTIEQEETREKIRDEFVDPNSGLDILIANPAACAESISLHKTCYHAVYYDLSYNCAQYLQSLDRIHRVGGSEFNQANYYFLQYRNTIENDIKSNLEAKAERMYSLIEEDFNIYSLNMFTDDDEIEAYERIFD